MQRQGASELCIKRLEWATYFQSDPGYHARVGIHHEQGEAKGLLVQKREWAFSPQGQGRQALTFSSTAEAQDNLDRSLI